MKAAQELLLGPGEAARTRMRDVEFVDMPVKQFLNRCGNQRMPFRWTINPAADASSHVARILRTGHGAYFRIFSAMPPIKRSSRCVCPRIDMTIRSTPSLLTNSPITS